MEEWLTLDELLITFEKIMENRTSQMEFSAKIAGAEIKASSSQAAATESSPTANKPSSLVDRLKAKVQNERQKEALEKGNATFSEGVAYRVI